jgi:hypothetical protein
VQAFVAMVVLCFALATCRTRATTADDLSDEEVDW